MVIKCPKRCFLLLCTLLKNGSKIFLIFCMSVEDNRAHCLSLMLFLKKFLILDYRGLNVQKFFCPFLQTTLRILLIFCKMVEDNRAHCLSKFAFLKKFLILDYRGLSDLRRCSLTFLGFFPKRL